MQRSEWFLGSALIGLLVLVIGLVTIVFFRPTLQRMGIGGGPPTLAAPPAATVQVPAATLDLPQKTAQVGFALAQQQAEQWQSDALLLSATATWPPGTQVAELRSGKAVWGYTFYSPSAHKVVIVSVSGERAILVRESAAPAQLAPLAAGGWQVDSDEVVNLVLTAGEGKDFLRREGPSTLTVSLTTNNRVQRIEWFASLVAAQTGHAITLLVDATSGEILELDRLP